MTMFQRILEAAADALSVPLLPAPGTAGIPSAVYRFYPGKSNSTLQTARLEVRIFARSPQQASAQLDCLRRAILSNGDSGVIGQGDDSLVVYETDSGGGSGTVRGCGLYFIKAGFKIQGRA